MLAASGTASYVASPGPAKPVIWSLTIAALMIMAAVSIYRFRRVTSVQWTFAWLALLVSFGALFSSAHAPGLALSIGPVAAPDLIRVLFYPFVLAATIRGARRHQPRTGARAMIEAAIPTLAAAAMIGAVLGPRLTSVPGPTGSEAILAGICATGDALVMAVVINALMRSTLASIAMRIAAAGFVALVVVDIAWWIDRLDNGPSASLWTGTGWLVAYSLLAVGPSVGEYMWEPLNDGHQRPELGRGRVVLLVASILIGPSWLIAKGVTWASFDLTLVATSIAIAGLTMVLLALHSQALAGARLAIEDAEQRADRLESRLEQSRSDRQRLLWRMNRAVEAERSRIAADLHARPLQELAGLGYQLERVSLALVRGDDSVEELIDGASDRLTKQIEAIRQIMTDMRPPLLDDRGLAGALAVLKFRFETEFPQITIALRGVEEGVHRDIETVFYRVAQQALRNTAAKATPARVSIALDGDEYKARLVISADLDDIIAPSREPDGPGRSFAVAGMHERVAMIGGTLNVQSSKSGTTIRVEAPREPVIGAVGPTRLLPSQP